MTSAVKIFTDRKQIQFLTEKYPLIMCYLCPVCNEPLLAYWKTDTLSPADEKQVGRALKDSGFGAYRFFQEEDGQGIEYDTDKDPKKRHMHQESSEYAWSDKIQKSWTIYMKLNPIVTVNALLSKMLMYSVHVPEDHLFISSQEIALQFIDRMRNEGLPLFMVIEDICKHGKPIFYFEEMQWGKRSGGYASVMSNILEASKIFGTNLMRKVDYGEDEEQLKEVDQALAEVERRIEGGA